jgi:chromosome segregation ATPase
MKTLRAVPVLVAAALAACTTDTQKQLDQMTVADAAHADSLAVVRQQLVEAVMTSAKFMNDINEQLAKARSLALKPALSEPGEIPDPNQDREEVITKIGQLVSRLDSVQTRLTSARTQIAQMSKKDSTLLAKVADFEKTVADLQTAAEEQRAQFQEVIDAQTSQIVGLTTNVSTLKDSVGRLTTEKNTAYVIIGTKEELIKKGVLVAEGSKRFLVVGARTLKPARTLDPEAFTKIDRTLNRTIVLPAGKYEIISRQNPTYASPTVKDGKVEGMLTIDQPEQFWEASPFLIIVRA